MFTYLFWHINVLINHGDDRINTEVSILDLDNMKDLSYKKSDLTIFYTIRKQIGVLPVYLDDPIVKRHLKFSFYQRKDDWYKP
jgi:hypothetical protein